MPLLPPAGVADDDGPADAVGASSTAGYTAMVR